MQTLITLRDCLRNLYLKFDYIIGPAARLVAAFAMLTSLQSYVGYNTFLSRTTVLLAASALCAVFPLGTVSLLYVLFLMGDAYEVSLMMTVFIFVVCFLILMLYFGFKPGYGLILSVVPFTFIIRIPFAAPIIMGLTAGLGSIIPAALGVVLYFIMHYLHLNASALKAVTATSDMLSTSLRMADAIFTDKYMYTVIIAFIICIVAVTIISRSGINHCWTLAVAAGTLVLLFVMVLGGSFVGSDSFAADIIGLLISLAVCLLYEMTAYAVDFRSAERLEFEDDDYYYYVKAVPKLHSMIEEEGRE